MKLHADPGFYHKVYGSKGPSKPRAVYYKTDFLDYVVMMALSALVMGACYGIANVMSIIGYALCAALIGTFVARHGIEFGIPVLLKEPWELLFVWAYKLRNLKAVYFFALGLLILENVLIRMTPNLPHHTNWMRNLALTLFYINVIGITAYRTVSLIDHLRKKEMVREILMQTPWQRSVKAETNMTVEILHAYATGVLSHLILLGPWYYIMTHLQFSLVFMVPVCILNGLLQYNWLKVANAWFYRNHWLGHNSEFQFVYFHGTHHDAIPSGLIAVSENGFLEGFFRHTIGWPNPFYHPVAAFWYYTTEIKFDMEMHQFIPGVFPRLPKGSIEHHQHSTHHYGPLEPYGFGFNLGEMDSYNWVPDQMRNAIKLDEEMGFKWDNPTFRQTVNLYKKYHDTE